MYSTLVIERETGISKLLNQRNEEVKFEDGMLVKIDRGDPFKLVTVVGGRASDVLPLPACTRLTDRRLDAMMTGPVKKFRADINLTDETQYLTVGLWLQFQAGGPKRYEFILGGPEVVIDFPVSNLGGHDGISGATPETRIMARQRPSGIRIKPGNHVSGWVNIEDRFPDSLSLSNMDFN